MKFVFPQIRIILKKMFISMEFMMLLLAQDMVRRAGDFLLEQIIRLQQQKIQKMTYMDMLTIGEFG